MRMIKSTRWMMTEGENEKNEKEEKNKKNEKN